MNMTINLAQAPNEAPVVAVPFGGIAPRRGSGRPPEPNKGDLAEQPAQHGNGTVWQADENGLGWTIDTSDAGQETKTTRDILDTIDAHTLRAAQVKGGTMPQIEANRDRIAALLGLRDEWKQPDEVYADEAWEICIIWRSGYGKVEIGTEEDGSVGYYVRRTLSEESREGIFEEHSREEISKVMSWLDEVHEEI